MQSKSPVILCVLALICLFVPSRAKADNIAIANADFSQLPSPAPTEISCGINCSYNLGPVQDWVTASGVAGTQILNSNFYSSVPSISGSMAFINGGKLTQDVGALLANTTYALTVYVGDRLDGYTTGYSFGLSTGPTTLAYWSNNGLITPGTFAPETISFTTGDNVSGDLTIFLADSGLQADFTNVSMTAVATPEPSSLIMLAIGLLGLFGLAKRYGFKPAPQAGVAS